MTKRQETPDKRLRKRVTVWSLRKIWRIEYDDVWREIMREVSDEFGISIEDVERINSSWWKYVGEMLARPELPQIRMMYLGTFVPSIMRLRKYCIAMGDHLAMLKAGLSGPGYFRNNKVGDIGAMEDHLAKLEGTYIRLGKEKKLRTGNSRLRLEMTNNLAGKMMKAREAKRKKLEKEKNDDKERANN